MIELQSILTKNKNFNLIASPQHIDELRPLQMKSSLGTLCTGYQIIRNCCYDFGTSNMIYGEIKIPYDLGKQFYIENTYLYPTYIINHEKQRLDFHMKNCVINVTATKSSLMLGNNDDEETQYRVIMQTIKNSGKYRLHLDNCVIMYESEGK